MDIANKKLKYANREGWVSIITNLILAGIKYWAGIISGSVALIADAWHTLTDSISSVVIIIGARISVKPADEKHPFGHGRIELISTFLVSIMLYMVAFSFLKESISRFNTHEDANYGSIAIIVTVASIIGKELLAQYAFYCARMSDSTALKADGWHHRSDSISSIIILIGILAGKNIWWMDSLLGVIVAVIIGYTALKLTFSTISRFLGEVPSEDIIYKIKSLSDEIAGEETLAHHFHLHDYVTHKELTFHLKMDSELNISEPDDLVTEIEKRIFDELEIHPTIHIEPKKADLK